MGTPDPSRADGRTPHIAQMIDETPARQRIRRSSDRPQRPLQRRPPISRWEPRCHHSTMARLYHGAYKCEHCGRSGHFGWVYRCIMDRDALIMDAKAKGRAYAFDALGLDFAEQMSLGKFGPDARAENYSFFKEITEQQLHTYTPVQLVTILSQRDKVHQAIAEERRNAGRLSSHYADKKYPDSNTPWVPSPLWECQHKVCQDCHHLGSDKSWLSLNGILNGDIPPHAATGFSFSHMGFRPKADVEVVKNIGYNAVPLPLNHASRSLMHRTASASTWRLLDIIDERIETASCSTCSDSSSISTSSESSESDRSPQIWRSWGQLPHSTAVQALPRSHTDPGEVEDARVCAAKDEALDVHSIFEEELLIRPPWTPPPSPSTKSGAALSNDPELESQLVVPGHEGRSPFSFKTNQSLRNRVFSSIPLAKQGGRKRDHQGHGCGTDNPQIPYQSEEMCDVGLFLPFNPEVYASACATLLPKPTMEEDMYFAKCDIGIVSGQDEETLSDRRCDIAGGVALTEEAAESGADDVVAHMGTPRRT